ncbi:MAG: hypothetical protein PVSMB1_17660 [Gemmatimonadaceae bacterium]
MRLVAHAQLGGRTVDALEDARELTGVDRDACIASIDGLGDADFLDDLMAPGVATEVATQDAKTGEIAVAVGSS